MYSDCECRHYAPSKETALQRYDHVAASTDGIGDKPMQVDPDVEYHGDEVHELLDLVQADGAIHDLDQYDPETMQSTLGATLCGLMKRLERAEYALSEIAKDHEACDRSDVDFGDRGEAYAKSARDVLAAVR